MIDEENKLGLKFPGSYRKFLLNYGCVSFCSVDFEGIGIYSTIYQSTNMLRKSGDISNDLIFILDDDEVYYLIDTSQKINDECPVVKYDLESWENKLSRIPISPTFGDFFIETFISSIKELENVDVPKDRYLPSSFPKINREELIHILTKIMNCIGTEQEIYEMVEFIEKNAPCPGFADLIFWSEKERSPEEIADIILSYKPKILPDRTKNNDEN